MKLGKPKVSVLIPTYNYARYLPEAIESVLGQDYGDFEVIIADDCSMDDSAEVIRRFANRDVRIRFHRHSSNMGMVSNWNWCLSQARGDYIKYLFGDDCFNVPHALSVFVGMLDANPSATIAASARSVLDEQSRLVERWDDLPSAGMHNGRSLIVRCLTECRNCIGEPTAVMFRRLQGKRGFDPSYRQLVDQEMWFHLLESGDLIYTHEPLCCFRRHALQQTMANKRQCVGDGEGIRLLAGYAARFRDPSALRFILFGHIYHLRKTHCEDSGTLQIAGNFMRQLGAYWYCVYWLRRKVTQPFLNLKHSIRKRWRFIPPRARASCRRVA
ncbi:MAG: glycosyltransferase family 2 protein [Verrucomicrobia bacterium]|nr:glycosyltransferase family 2 protein [Verrucomicrobiota bacterium]